MSDRDWTVADLMDDYQAGRVSRRGFVRTLVGAGFSMPLIVGLLSACGSDEKKSDSGSGTSGSGVRPSPVTGGFATQAPGAAAFTPAKRGEGGTLKLLWWQAPSILNPHQSSGTKDRDGSRIFYEPLAAIDAEGNVVPILAAEVPSVDKGTLDKSGKFVTWKIKKGVTWHDGQPFTVDDVIFTWKYAVDADTAALTVGSYQNIESIDKVDDSTIKVNFKTATLEWTAPFVSSAGQILPKHVFEKYLGKEAKSAPPNLKPVGTGPFKINDFKPNDIIIADMNDKYHVENWPYFNKVEMKGGGDAPGAARAVLQTGEYDYAWNLQVEYSVLQQLEKGGAGVLAIGPGSGIEHLQLNYTDPNKEVDGEKASLKAPHPFFADLKVRQAFQLAINRKVIVEQLYGPTGDVAIYYFYNPKRYVPDGGKWEFNLQKAGQLLDEAGWKKGGSGTREKDGVKMKVLYQTSVNTVRQNMQAVIKKDLESLGVEVELKSVIADVFFGADPANPDNFPHFYADMQSYTATRSGPDDLATAMKTYLSSEIKQKANNWSKLNSTRYNSKEFDALFEAAVKELDPTKAAEAWKKCNQKLIDDVAVIPIVARNNVAAAKKDLRGMGLSPWDSDVWNIAKWYRQK